MSKISVDGATAPSTNVMDMVSPCAVLHTDCRRPDDQSYVNSVYDSASVFFSYEFCFFSEFSEVVCLVVVRILECFKFKYILQNLK